MLSSGPVGVVLILGTNRGFWEWRKRTPEEIARTLSGWKSSSTSSIISLYLGRGNFYKFRKYMLVRKIHTFIYRIVRNVGRVDNWDELVMIMYFSHDEEKQYTWELVLKMCFVAGVLRSSYKIKDHIKCYREYF